MGIATKSKTKATKKASIPIPKKTVSLPSIIGGPPETGSSIDVTDNLRRNSRLLIDVSPCTTAANQGPSLFSLTPSWKKYEELLKDVGFSPSASQIVKKSIRFACSAENFPTDTFSNEYGEHFLNQITDVAGGGFGQLAQMMGKDTATGALKELGGLSEGIGKSIGGTLGHLVGGLGGALHTIGEGGHNAINKMVAKGGLQGSIGQSMQKLLAGAKIDFPMIWKNSSYNPTFSCNIRLYNPNPASKSTTMKYIIGPLAAILTLVLPQSEDQNFYNWPFFCMVECKGLFKIPMGAITNVTITKGGDSGLVSFNQRVSMVDIRMDFINLHSTILLSKNGAESRPTLKGYLDNMISSHEPAKIYGESNAVISDPTASNILSKASSMSSNSSNLDSPPPARTDTSILNRANDLINQGTFYT